MTTKTRHRVAALAIYAIVLVLVQQGIVSTGLTPNENAIWLYTGLASLLFGSRLLNPHFTPPADAATNSFVAMAGLVAGSLVTPPGNESLLLWLVVIFCGLVCVTSVAVLLVRPPLGADARPWVRIPDRAVRGLGSPNVIFTIVMLASVLLFHRERPIELFAILAVWTVIVAILPVESVLDFIDWSLQQTATLRPELVVGPIVAHQSPGIVLVRQGGDHSMPRGTPLLVADDNGPWMLGVALNYVGRDEGNLLRVLTATLPAGLRARVGKLPSTSGQGMALALAATPDDLADIPAIQWINRLCGIVVTDTSLDHIFFEVTDERDLEEGRLVEARIGPERTIFQVIDGMTKEDIVQQKNTYGYARGKARKIGRWDAQTEKFMPVNWLPQMNAPVFLLEQEGAVAPRSVDVGRFPGTNYGVSLNLSDAVTHNTAVLGILGIGKSYLAVELVERMMSDGIKVICLDLTNQYAQVLSEFLHQPTEEGLDAALLASGQGGAAHQNQEQGGSHLAFKARVVEQLRAFVQENEPRKLRVINPAQFEVTRQAGGMFNGNANMATLTPTEITAIISDAALTVAQELGMTDKARLCLVYEEAHSLVPEWNSVVAEGDKAATARSARAILQGRKYGLGCLLVTQRTANVTKTILNQCNTIFAMRTFDDTGMEFLANYIGRDYAAVLPSLQARHAVLFGKASSCENPVLVRLNDRDTFLAAFRPENPVQDLQPALAPPAPAQPLPAPIPGADDDIPF